MDGGLRDCNSKLSFAPWTLPWAFDLLAVGDFLQVSLSSNFLDSQAAQPSKQLGSDS